MNIPQIIKDLSQEDFIVVDVETTGVDVWGGDKICGLAIGGPNSGSHYVPFRHAVGNNVRLEWLKEFGHLIEDSTVIGHNYAQFDDHMLRNDGVGRPAVLFDTLLGAHLANENEYVYNHAGEVVYGSDGKPKTIYQLKELVRRHCGFDTEPEERLVSLLRHHFGSDSKGNLWKLPVDAVRPYAVMDVQATLALFRYLSEELGRQELTSLWQEISEYALIVGAMERRGLLINTSLCEQLGQEADTRASEIRLELSHIKSKGSIDLFGQPMFDFNPDSSPQVCELLGIESSAKAVLEKMKNGTHKGTVEKILEYRLYSKARGNYYHKYLRMVDGNRILRPSYNLAGTVAGRPSCKNPNLQAVARRTEVYRVKDVFEARPGFELVSIDYSQAEVRVGAFFGKESTMLELLALGQSIHKHTEASVGSSYDHAKRLNFGAIYGIGAKSFAAETDLPLGTAKQYLNSFHSTYPGFRWLYAECQRKAAARGFISMFTLRRRRYDGDHSPYHKASSNLIQGTVAEILRLAIMDIVSAALEDVHMLLQVHDQILFEIPLGTREKNIPVLVDLMERAAIRHDPRFTVPLPVDVVVGPNWGQMEEYNVN